MTPVLIALNLVLALLLVAGLVLVATGRRRRAPAPAPDPEVSARLDALTADAAPQPEVLVPVVETRPLVAPVAAAVAPVPAAAAPATPVPAPVASLAPPPDRPAAAPLPVRTPTAPAAVRRGGRIEVATGGARPSLVIEGVMDALAAHGLAVESFTDSRCLLTAPGGGRARVSIERVPGTSVPHPSIRILVELDRVPQDPVSATVRRRMGTLAPVLRVRTPTIEVLGRESEEAVIVVEMAASGAGSG